MFYITEKTNVVRKKKLFDGYNFKIGNHNVKLITYWKENGYHNLILRDQIANVTFKAQVLATNGKPSIGHMGTIKNGSYTNTALINNIHVLCVAHDNELYVTEEGKETVERPVAIGDKIDNVARGVTYEVEHITQSGGLVLFDGNRSILMNHTDKDFVKATRLQWKPNVR